MRLKMFGKGIQWYNDYSAGQFLEALEDTFPGTISWDETGDVVAIMCGDLVNKAHPTDWVIGFFSADEVVSEAVFRSAIDAY